MGYEVSAKTGADIEKAFDELAIGHHRRYRQRLARLSLQRWNKNKTTRLRHETERWAAHFTFDAKIGLASTMAQRGGWAKCKRKLGWVSAISQIRVGVQPTLDAYTNTKYL